MPDLGDIIDTYIHAVRDELRIRVELWDIDLVRESEYMACAALLGRQISLATQLARAPSTWNEHAAPLFLRAMADVIINMKWILADPTARAQQFISHGLGQAKLIMEHRKTNNPNDPAAESLEDWMSEFTHEAFVEVNVGSWSGVQTRKMAEDVGESELYRFAFAPFSSCVHSTFDHAGRFNITRSQNPLHRYIAVPVDPDLPCDAHYITIAAKYVDKCWHITTPLLKQPPSGPSAYTALVAALDEMARSQNEAIEPSDTAGDQSSPQSAAKNFPENAMKVPNNAEQSPMPNESNKFDTFERAIKLVKELVLVVLGGTVLVLMLPHVPRFGHLIDKFASDDKIGVTKFDFAGFTVERVERDLKATLAASAPTTGKSDQAVPGAIKPAADSLATIQGARPTQLLEREGVWVYLGTGQEKFRMFRGNDAPKSGDVFVANTDIFKRATPPKEVAPDKWVLGSVVGVLKEGEPACVVEITRVPGDGAVPLLWARVQTECKSASTSTGNRHATGPATSDNNALLPVGNQ